MMQERALLPLHNCCCCCCCCCSNTNVHGLTRHSSQRIHRLALSHSTTHPVSEKKQVDERRGFRLGTSSFLSHCSSSSIVILRLCQPTGVVSVASISIAVLRKERLLQSIFDVIDLVLLARPFALSVPPPLSPRVRGILLRQQRVKS